MKLSIRQLEGLLFIVVLVLSSGAFAPLWTDPSKHDVVGGQRELEALWSAVYLCAVVSVLRYRDHVVRLFSTQKLLLLLLCWTGLSITWSSDPIVSSRKFVALVGSTALGLLLALRFRMHEHAWLLGIGMLLVAFLSLFAGLHGGATFPATETAGDAWNGIFSHKNVLGRAMAFGAIALLSVWARRLSYSFAAAGFLTCAFLILRAHSQTALVVLGVALLLTMLSPILRWRWRESLGVAALLVLLSSLCVGLTAANATTVAGWLHRDLTLTGRATIWEYAWLDVMRHPILGYGYSGFWWVAPDSYQTMNLLHYATPHAHNGLLDLALQIGFVGVSIFVVSWCVNWAAAFRYFRSFGSASSWPILFLTCLFVYSLTENALLVPNSMTWIMYVSTLFGLSRATLNNSPGESSGR